MHSHTCRDRHELADSGKLSHDALRAQLEAKTYGAFRAQARSRMRRGEPPSLGRCLGARPSISVYAEGLKIKQRRAQRKKTRDAVFDVLTDSCRRAL